MPIDCGTSAVCSAIVNYAVPGVGCITTAAIFLAPWAGVVQVTKRKSLGEVNPVPFAWMCCNSLGWVVYGQKVQNYFVAVPNVVGYLFGIHYFLTTYPFATIRQRKLLFLILFLGSAVVFSMAVVANIGLSNDAETSRLVLGYTAVAILIVFYSSPLSTLYDVIKRRDASSLGPALAIASAVNGGFWSIYGFAINDAFVFSPNLVGAVVGIVQLILIGIFGRGKSRTPLRQDPENDSLEGATSARDTVSDSNEALTAGLYSPGKQRGLESGNGSSSAAVPAAIYDALEGMESANETVVVDHGRSDVGSIRSVKKGAQATTSNS